MRRNEAGVAANAPRLFRPMIALAPQLSRYSAVSALALGLDFVVYLALVGSGFAAPLAGAIGYAIGLTLHYALSARFVFDARATRKSDGRLFGEFAMSGLVGLFITASIIAIATEMLHLGALAAKMLAAGASFLAVFLLRRSVVFGGGLALRA